MNEQSNPFAMAAKGPKKPETIASLLSEDRYKKRFEQVLGERAPQFISSILSLGTTLHDVEPRSVLAGCAIAASLNLPVNPTLGFAWIVPYKKNGVKYGQFICGYRGLIQLAQRTGAYRSMNAEEVNAEVYKGRNKVGEPIIDWELMDETKPIAGYVYAFEMVNGFTKICYWSKDKVERHAQRYSQSYRGGFDSPWKDNFGRMALKTVVSNELRRWGMLSVELQGAFAEDHTVHRDLDAPAEFPDASDEIMRPKFDDKIADAADAKATAAEEKAESAAGLAPATPAQTPSPAEQPRRGRKRAAEAQPAQTAAPAPVQPAAPAPTPPAMVAAAQEHPPTTPLAKAPAAPAQSAFAALASESYNQLRTCMEHSQITDAEVIALCRSRGMMTEAQHDLISLGDAVLTDLVDQWTTIAGWIRIERRKAAGK